MSPDVREKILSAAEKRMMTFGYRKVLVDEIARDLAMSKNTIYKHFQSKTDIAILLFERLKIRINKNQQDVQARTSDPLEIIYQNVSFLQKELSPWFEHFLSDIKQELPALWDDFTAFRAEKILEIEDLVKEGIQRTEFRPIDPAMAVRVFLGAVEKCTNPEVLQNENVSFQKVLENVLDIWSNGIKMPPKP
ncbi:MAG TPA: TetR/AcrR family transcriptional regulator [Candidatus Omnitrophota bacterium]|nr:TetR/AcrR family transcriptional regulator [Candidatus Omnitrophota bacterium]HPB67540.1 TetR/AcrR family transcriptional regulator [Candidatus Omnitrophota bacterium]HQO58198.1 TetR/AcrR family transcriptional regulator [Candidatus Omnitrophota bacterium]HQP12191.1 TetR/AcrR family transcriptional regulator [Candidatus Omnitrophota bacterium]